MSFLTTRSYQGLEWPIITHLLILYYLVDACILPDGSSQTYWHSYSQNDEIIVMEFDNSTIKKKNIATNTYEGNIVYFYKNMYVNMIGKLL